MKQLTKKSLMLIPIALCSLALSGCGQSSNDDVGNVHTDVTNTKHHDSKTSDAEKSDKHKAHKDSASKKDSDKKENKSKDKDKHSDSSSKKHKKGDDSTASSKDDKNLKNETQSQDKKTTSTGNASNNGGDNNNGQDNKNAAGQQQGNNNGNNQVYTAAQDNQKFMNTKPDKVLPPVNTSTPQQPSNTGDLKGKVTYQVNGGGQAQQDDRKVNVSGNTASYDGQSISANDFNTAKKYFQSKKLDEPDYIYFEWAKYAKDHKCSLDDAYKQNVNMVN